jgi:PEGA domain-containing protein
MRKTMRIASIALAAIMTGGLLMCMASTASAQRVRQRIVIVEREPFFFDPFFPYYGYYPYPPSYMAANYGEVKIKTHRKDAKVYIDGGYAARIREASKFALRPGNHEIELRNSDGVTFYRERVAVTVGHTTKLHVA